MSSDIQFGDLEQSEPQPAIRPDQDAHFATTTVGQVGDDELLIFVDLDVMRDMEAHALSNTRVELGGVMLGQQKIDDRGRPFVVVSECLRAEHYEATNVNFKFTHETWSQITRQRSEFRPDLEMVGWYHTHPGLTVFLSGMDLFICNNFFNRPLDVALVIDPCGQDRGWFQWTDESQPKTQRTNGFVLTTGRLRQIELDQFACIYNKEPTMNLDPRYSGTELTGSAQPLVHLMDNRKPLFELVVIGMLMTQFLLFCGLAWRYFDSAEAQSASLDQKKIVELENRLEQMQEDQVRTVREEAYREMLQTLAASQPGDASLVDQFAELKSEQAMMDANLVGQMALVKQLQSEHGDAVAQLEVKSADAKHLETQLVNTRIKLTESQGRVDQLTSELEGNSDSSSGAGFSKITMPWWWLLVGSVLTIVAGVALGFAWGRQDDPSTPRRTGAPESQPSASNFKKSGSRGTAGTASSAEDVTGHRDAVDPVSMPMTIDGTDSANE